MPTVEGIGIALGGFALDLYVSGDPVSRRVPLKRLRTPEALLDLEDPLKIADARPAGDGVRVVFSDGEVVDFPIESLLGPPPGEDDLDAVVFNAAAVLTMREPAEMPLGRIAHGAVAIRGGRVAWVGLESDLALAGSIGPRTVRIDAERGLVTPGFIDAHTHPVFGGTRASEFALRAAGKSYADIQAAGGGIYATVRATRDAEPADLLQGARVRLSRMLAWGVTSCEAKSGYALAPAGELALLGVLGEAAAGHAVDLSPTLLAHVLPEDYADRRAEYVQAFAGALVHDVVRARLADSCDVYCDQGAFTLDEARTILTAAKTAGLAPRLHAEQFTRTGAAELAAQLGARSADHLEQISDAGVVMLAQAGVVATLLPGAALALRLPWPPARRLADAGVRIALGTDCNPGSSMTEALPLMMSIGCMQMGLTVEEAWMGVTAHAARAIGRGDLGRLVPGARADLAVFACDDPAYVPYHYGHNHVHLVVKDGSVAYRA
ncbi:MAG TPA: imidazolonepropionase [Polyangia bacterium]|nr:imidazolonepropionase [Polyangia bacterium]